MSVVKVSIESRKEEEEEGNDTEESGETETEKEDSAGSEEEEEDVVVEGRRKRVMRGVACGEGTRSVRMGALVVRQIVPQVVLYCVVKLMNVGGLEHGEAISQAPQGSMIFQSLMEPKKVVGNVWLVTMSVEEKCIWMSKRGLTETTSVQSD
ncbi:hypothetical protein FNV43_RR18674 [Rhamnella rubrinervis]|uniref:Uncharacterized protein n=1 Tax=Rhamnella rubrinervis TaxID=2594499 RepID=A0A8K0DZT6_9ROSA|nr:hypothetical protein FNV43_RR18674 [Rhamnella rubrinervis]